jgi:hypothetical protein
VNTAPDVYLGVWLYLFKPTFCSFGSLLWVFARQVFLVQILEKKSFEIKRQKVEVLVMHHFQTIQLIQLCKCPFREQGYNPLFFAAYERAK